MDINKEINRLQEAFGIIQEMIDRYPGCFVCSCENGVTQFGINPMPIIASAKKIIDSGGYTGEVYNGVMDAILNPLNENESPAVKAWRESQGTNNEMPSLR